MLFLRGQRSESEGFALVAVLLLVALVSVIATVMATRARVEVKLSANSSASLQAELGARSGVVYVEAALDKAKLDVTKVSLPTPSVPTPGAGLTQAASPSQSTATQADSATGADGWKLEAASADDPLFDGDDRTKFTITVTDECARINVNTATTAVLKALPGMTDEVVACIIDWRDSDDTPGQGGAEKDWYGAQDPPMKPRNGPFQTVDELLLVKGMTRELFFGTGAAQTQSQATGSPAATTSASTPTQNVAAAPVPGLRDLVTVWSVDANLTSDGQAKIALGSRNLVADLNRRLGLNRQDGQSLQNALARWPGGSQPTLAQFGQVLEQARGISDSLKRRAFGVVTGGQGGTVPGRVNLMTARSTVLEAMFGKDLATKVLDAKEQKKLRDLWDVWGIIRSSSSAAQQIDNVTMSTKQFRFESQGVAGPRSVQSHILAVVDRSTAKWQNRYWATTP